AIRIAFCVASEARISGGSGCREVVNDKGLHTWLEPSVNQSFNKLDVGRAVACRRQQVAKLYGCYPRGFLTFGVRCVLLRTRRQLLALGQAAAQDAV
ncbi:MAG: hypothetical protein ACJA0V_004275, partial [Planctomycetota bacterium]